jgi:predicted DNA-binding protein (MmcQ/YjbR family)
MNPRTQALKAVLESMPGAVGEPMTASRGTEPLVVLYKVMGKMFAILSARGEEFVILKSDPHLAEVLREQYEGVGHRSHLDRRFWISVSLDADVPAEEAARLAASSYALVCAGLTKKQKAALAGL